MQKSALRTAYGEAMGRFVVSQVGNPAIMEGAFRGAPARGCCFGLSFCVACDLIP